MKKVISLILACVLCAGVAVAASGCGCEKSKKATTASDSKSPGYRVEPTSPDFEEGDFSFYRLNDKEVKVTVYKGSDKNVEIPATAQGANVSVIEANLFQNSEIESVKIPDTVTEIQKYAFSGCQNLKEVVIPEGVKTIGVNAFWNCRNLESVSLPSTLKNIDWNAFSATGLKSVTIPESNTLSTLKEKVFFQCSELKEVILPISITGIADDTFEQCSEDLVIKAYTGSYGLSYAQSHNIKFEELSR